MNIFYAILSFMAKYDSKLDLLFSALSDPTRRDILTRLSFGTASITELAEQHDMALPSFLKHLNKLEEAGLIHSEKNGRIRTCALTPDAFTPMQSWLSEQRAIWEQRLNQFDRYALELKRKRENETGSKN